MAGVNRIYTNLLFVTPNVIAYPNIRSAEAILVVFAGYHFMKLAQAYFLVRAERKTRKTPKVAR